MPLIQSLGKDYSPSGCIGCDIATYRHWAALENAAAGFEKRDAADVFCCEQIELRALLRPGLRHNQVVSASLRRFCFVKATRIALNIMQSA